MDLGVRKHSCQVEAGQRGHGEVGWLEIIMVEGKGKDWFQCLNSIKKGESCSDGDVGSTSLSDSR